MKFQYETKWKIDELLKHRATINLNPPYQTAIRWTDGDRRKLIESVLMGRYIPPFVFHRRPRAETGTSLDTLDSKQRQIAIYRFVDGQFSLNEGKGFKELTSDERHTILNHQIHIIEFDERMTDEEAEEQFIDLQRGVPLNPQEKRGGRASNPLVSLVKRLANHRFVTGLLIKSRSRTFHQELVFKYLFWAAHGLKYRADARNLDEAMVDETFDPSGVAAEKVESALDFFVKTFGDRVGELRNQTLLYDLFIVFLELRQRNILTQAEAVFGAWALDFEAERKALVKAKKPAKTVKPYIRQYQEASLGGTQECNMLRRRRDMMLKSLEDLYPSLFPSPQTVEA